jgi:hypothetical protein
MNNPIGVNLPGLDIVSVVEKDLVGFTGIDGLTNPAI